MYFSLTELLLVVLRPVLEIKIGVCSCEEEWPSILCQSTLNNTRLGVNDKDVSVRTT
jgi:hypothetical protein